VTRSEAITHKAIEQYDCFVIPPARHTNAGREDKVAELTGKLNICVVKNAV
jgi:hypothetical protein